MCRCEKIARLRRRAVLVVVTLALAVPGACSTPLPDPQSAGAQIYQVRCSGCHAPYAPAPLTAAMWGVQGEPTPAGRGRGAGRGAGHLVVGGLGAWGPVGADAWRRAADQVVVKAGELRAGTAGLVLGLPPAGRAATIEVLAEAATLASYAFTEYRHDPER